MAEVTPIAGLAALLLAGLVTWHTMWHRRVESRLVKIPVERGRSVRVVPRTPNGIATGRACARTRRPNGVIFCGAAPRLTPNSYVPFT
jgi:hypothetical protein